MILIEKLHHITRRHHQQAERLSLFQKIVHKSISRLDYIILLKKLQGFWRPLEQRFAQLPFNDFYFQERTKLPALHRDLSALGLSDIDIEILPLCKKIPSINNLYSFLGCLYVMEGSTLGSQILARLVIDCLNIDQTSGGAYFFGYGASTMRLWDCLCERLNTLTTTEKEEQIIIDSAIATFNSFNRWFITD